MKHFLPDWAVKAILLPILLLLINCRPAAAGDTPGTRPFDLNEIEREINAYVPDPHYEDDPFILITLKEAIQGSTAYNGGIGACLVNEANGEVVERGHNRQYEPYFRSDLHAEMDVLNRYEDRMKVTRIYDPHDSHFSNPRNKQGLILYTSLEPCPMCLTRIINSGIKKVYYAALDEDGGMAHRFEDLPPFWQTLAQGMTIEPARCSPDLRILAIKLFRPMHRHSGSAFTKEQLLAWGP